MFMAFSLLLIPLAKSIYFLAIPAILFGIAMSLNIPVLQGLLTGMAPMQYRAAIVSINSMVLRVGQTLGPIMIGGIYALGDINYIFYAGVLIALIMFALAFKVRINPTPH